MMKPSGKNIVKCFMVANFVFAGINAYQGKIGVALFDFIIASALAWILYKNK